MKHIENTIKTTFRLLSVCLLIFSCVSCSASTSKESFEEVLIPSEIEVNSDDSIGGKLYFLTKQIYHHHESNTDFLVEIPVYLKTKENKVVGIYNDEYNSVVIDSLKDDVTIMGDVLFSSTCEDGKDNCLVLNTSLYFTFKNGGTIFEVRTNEIDLSIH